MFTLTIKTTNAAFAEDNGEQTPEALTAEVARILRDIAAKVEAGSRSGMASDSNGNNVGTFSLHD